MIEIELTKGYKTLIDDEDFELVSQYKWHTHISDNKYYAATNIPGIDGRQVCTYLHRLIIDVKQGQEIDHKDGNGLNNLRSNLRVCSRTENGSNLNKQNRPTSSKYKGVSWAKRERKWRCRIKQHQKETHIGYFSSEEDAARAYDIAAKELFGEFANLNFEEVYG